MTQTESGFRHSKWDDPEIQKTILDAIRGGNYFSTAAKLAGVHPDSLHDWIRRGRDGKAGIADTHPTLIEFVEKIELAVAEWEAETVKVVQDTARSGKPNTWQAAMTMLERKAPDRWGRRDKVEVDVEASKPLVQFNQLVLTDAEVRKESRELLRRFVALNAQTELSAATGEDEPAEIETEGEEDDSV